MELYQLKSFLTIAREQNLTRAANILHLSQSALSSQIKLLEEDLGVSLFDRTSRGMILSDHGRVLQPHAQDVLEAAEKMHQQAVALNRGVSDSVAIGLNTDPTFLKVSAINQRLGLLQPNTSLVFHICQSTETVQKLRHNQIDLGFFYGDNQETDIEHIVINQVRTCVVIPTALASPDQRLEWSEIAALPWVWVDNNFPFFKALQQSLDDFRIIPKQAVTAVDEQIVRELVATGQGVAIMREDEARPLVERGQVSIWRRGWGNIPLCLGWTSRNRDEPRIKAAREVISYLWRKPEEAADSSLTDKCWV